MAAADDRPGVARSAGVALATQILTAAFTAAVTLFLIRELGPAQFGVFSLAMGIAGLALLPADLGIAQSAARFVAERRGERDSAARVLGAATRMKVLAGAAVALGLVLLAGPLAEAFDEPTLTWTLRGMALAVFAQSMLTLYLEAFIAVGRLATNLRIVAAESFVEAGAIVLLVLASSGAAAAAYGRAIGYAAGLLVALAFVVGHFGREALSARRRPGVPPVARYASVMLVVNGVFSLYSQIDVLLIGALLSSAAVGHFSAPNRLFVLFSYAGLAISSAVSPRMARTGDGEPAVESFRAALRLLMVSHAVFIPPMLLWARPIVELVLGDDYGESVDVVRVLAPVILLQGISPLLSVSVNYLGGARSRIPVAVVALLVKAAIDLALLREIGVVAAAISTLAGYTVYVGGHAWICHRMLDLDLRALALSALRSALAATAMAGVLLGFGTGDLAAAELVLGGLLGAAVYLAVLLVTREIGRDDLETVRRLYRRAA